MDKKEFLEKHLAHRKMVLEGFVTRHQSDSPEAFRAKMDGTIVTCRSLWELLGVTMYSVNISAQEALKKDPEFRSSKLNIENLKIISVTKPEFSKIPENEDIKKVLIAGNKCVAHFDEHPDHDVTSDILDSVITRTLKEIDSRLK